MLLPTMAGAEPALRPDVNVQRTLPVIVLSANIVGLAGLVSIDPAKTTPPATLAGPKAAQPLVVLATAFEQSPGVGVCHMTPPLTGFNAAQDPLFTVGPEGLSA